MEINMNCCEGLRADVTSRRALLLGGASFAAWAYLPKFARAADGRDPRLVVIILRGALDGLATVAPIGDPDYAGLHGAIALASSRPERGVAAGFVLRAASGDARVCADVSRQEGRGGSRGGDVLSRPLAFRRTGCSGKRFCRARPRAIRLAQPCAGIIAARRSGLERARGRPNHAAGVARRGSDGRLGAGRASSSGRRYRNKARRTLQPARSRAGRGADAGTGTRQGGAGRRHEAEARHQRRRRDAAGGAGRGETDGGRRRPADRRTRLRRLGHPRQ